MDKYFKDDVPHEIKVKRLDELLELQKRIDKGINEARKAKEIQIIVEDTLKDGKFYDRIINNKIVISEKSPRGFFVLYILCRFLKNFA
ncbi:hypothetical protein [Kosmotoga pacifica]|uniref:Uncharacterized protein n=1 Tax=Kosmotoga pacifica TaxID=1330330 RepID=A0A0G2ZCA3_9BACT|nr:hypothetical protein [Kosmotoga pacifica]AKI97169.1 hypothetical protein IX53_04355 [Kosmotoga pacifica]